MSCQNSGVSSLEIAYEPNVPTNLDGTTCIALNELNNFFTYSVDNQADVTFQWDLPTENYRSHAMTGSHGMTRLFRAHSPLLLNLTLWTDANQCCNKGAASEEIVASFFIFYPNDI